MGRMWVAKQKLGSTQLQSRVLRQSCQNAQLLGGFFQPNNATFISNPVLSMEDFQPPHEFSF